MGIISSDSVNREYVPVHQDELRPDLTLLEYSFILMTWRRKSLSKNCSKESTYPSNEYYPILGQ